MEDKEIQELVKKYVLGSDPVITDGAGYRSNMMVYDEAGQYPQSLTISGDSITQMGVWPVNMKTGGNVGMGTTAPDLKFHIPTLEENLVQTVAYMEKGLKDAKKALADFKRNNEKFEKRKLCESKE